MFNENDMSSNIREVLPYVGSSKAVHPEIIFHQVACVPIWDNISAYIKFIFRTTKLIFLQKMA